VEEIEIWRGVRGEGFEDVGRIGFIGEFLGVVDVTRGDDWVERCVLYLADDGSIVTHRMRLSTIADGEDIADVHIIPALDKRAADNV